MDNFYTKSFVIPFYKAFLGFFILVILISGVFMEFRQHVLLAERVLENDKFFLGVLGVFSIFGFFQQRYQLNLMNEARYRVFHSLAFFSVSKLVKVHLAIWPKTHALLLIYAAFLTYIGLISQSLLKPLLLWVFLIAVFSIDFSLFYYKLRRPFPDKAIPKSFLFPRIPFGFWFLKHLTTNRPILIISIKLVSLIVLNGFFFSYESGGYDLRWIAFGLLCAAFIHFPVWMEKVRFDAEELSYFLNLPRSTFLKIRHLLTSIVLFILPELILIGIKFNGQELGLIVLNLSFFYVSMNLGLLGLVVFQSQHIDWTKAIIGAFFLIFLVILFSVPFYFIAFLGLAAFILAVKNPYRI
jgi:hypothetical protein